MPTTANTPPHGNATPPPAHMTGAELQTLREAAGLSREALAELVGVQARTVKHWEHGRGGVPADVASVAQHWAGWVRSTAQAIRAGATWLREGVPCGPEVILRYHETEQMNPAHRRAGARADTHGAAVAMATQLLALDGLPARVVWFDPEAFTTWRSAHQADDTPASRAAWAQAAALPAQAIPPRGDQPPPDFAPGYGTPSTGTARTRSRP